MSPGTYRNLLETSCKYGVIQTPNSKGFEDTRRVTVDKKSFISFETQKEMTDFAIANNGGYYDYEYIRYETVKVIIETRLESA